MQLLYRLSYAGLSLHTPDGRSTRRLSERETGLDPATLSLEG